MADRHIPKHRAGVARVDDAVVVQHPGQHHRQRLGLDLTLDRGPHRGVGLLVDLLAAGLGGGPADDRQHARQLRAAHHRGLRARPGEQEPRVVGASAHAVVARAVGRADQQRDVRDGRVRHGVDHHRAVLDHPAFLVLLADHVAGRVVQEQQWRVGAVGQLDELGGLLRLLAEQHAAVVGEDADRIAVQVGPAGHQRRAVERLELVELRAVDDAGDDVARVERDPQIGRHDAEQFLGVEQRLGDRARCRALLAPVQPRDDAAADPDGVEFVDGEVVRQTRSAGVHFGAAERFVVGLLAGGHLHQRRSGQEHLRALLDHHDVVGHAGDVGAARGGVAEHQRNGRDARRRQPGQVAEHLAAGDEDLLLGRQVGAAGLHQRDHRKAVLHRNLVGAQHLLQRPRVAGAALDGRVVGDEQALDALDHADAGHHAGADLEVGAVCGQRAQLQERRVGVEQHLDALARGHLAAVVVALDVLLAAAGQRLGVLGVELGELGRHRLGRLGVGRRAGIQRRRQRRHDWYPSVFAASEVRISVVPPPMPRIRMSRYWRSTSDSAM